LGLILLLGCKSVFLIGVRVFLTSSVIDKLMFTGSAYRLSVAAALKDPL